VKIVSAKIKYGIGRTALAAGLAILGAIAAGAAVLVEDFSSNPLLRGWQVAGCTNLFHWNAAAQNLEVVWDSRQSNSFFYRPLGVTLTRGDDFRLEFDLRLSGITAGIVPDKPYTFEIAVGLTALRNITNENFFRGTGINSMYGPRDLVELDYFPEAGAVSATIAPTIVYSNNRFDYSHNFPLEMAVGDLFHVEMGYTASNRVLRTRILRNGQPYSTSTNGFLHDIVITNAFDFAVDALAVSSYNDGQQSPMFGGSVFAEGVVDNFLLYTLPWPEGRLVLRQTESGWAVEFQSRAGWRHLLQRSHDLLEWLDVSAPVDGTGEIIRLTDETTGSNIRAFYRVKTQRP